MSDQFAGAKPEPSAPKKPGAVSQPASKPLHRDADGCYPVAADSNIIGGWANKDNNNQDSNKRPKPSGNNPDSHVDTPQGKPFA